MFIHIVKVNLRNLKNVMIQKTKLERQGVCRNVSKFKVESVKCVKTLNWPIQDFSWILSVLNIFI